MGEFDLTKTYSKVRSKEEVIGLIERCYDEEFVVVLLPRSKDNADMLIRSIKLDCKEGGKE